MHGGFERLRVPAGAGHDATQREEIAAAVDVPREILVGGAVLPGDLIPACRLLRADRNPGAELARRDGHAAVAQLDGRRPAIVHEVGVRDLGQCGRAGGLDGRRGYTGRPVAVEILAESRLEGFERRTCCGQRRTLRKEVAAAVDTPRDVLIGDGIPPDDQIAAAALLRADRSPRAELTHRDRPAAKAQGDGRRSGQNITVASVELEAGRPE